MKVTYFGLKPAFPFRIASGGQRSLNDLMQAGVDSKLWQVQVFCALPLDHASRCLPNLLSWRTLGVRSVKMESGWVDLDCGYSIRAFFEANDLFKCLDEQISCGKPDLIITGQRGSLEVAKRAAASGVPVILNLDTAPGQGVYSVTELCEAEQIGLIAMCCSEYVRNRVRDLTDGRLKCGVVYPAMRRALYTIASHSAQTEYVTIINPVEVKGGHIFQQIASSMPNEKFLAVIGWELENTEYWIRFREKMMLYNNVTVVERCADIRDVLRHTKLLLVPSQWDEAFGRVVWEAKCSGIPSLVSETGGLPEVLGRGGLLVRDFSNPSAWINLLRTVLDDHELYCQLRCNALAEAEEEWYSPARALADFSRLVNCTICHGD